MFWCAWIVHLFLAGTFGDLSFLVKRQDDIEISERGGGGGHNHCDEQCMINEMLVNVGMAFDKDHCKAFEHVTCPDTVIPNEQLCSNIGNTYPNHCQFVQASCTHHHKHDTFQTISHDGPCVTATVTQQAVSTTQKVNATSQQAQSTTQNVMTQAPMSTTTMNLTGQTTIPLFAQIVGQVFCSHRDQFICDKTFDVICGSDGQYYPNSCEFSKTQCDDYTLVQKDIMFCSTQTIG